MPWGQKSGRQTSQSDILVRLDADKVAALGDGLKTLAKDGCLAVSVPFFTPDEVESLKQQALSLPMRKASPVVGASGKEVKQDFDICFPAPRIGALDALARALEEGVNTLAGELLALPFVLNDIAVQHYPVGSAGIGTHRDGLRYQGLVFIIALAGESRLCACAARSGAGAWRIDDSPGMLTILSASGFAGRQGEGRPFHFVDGVSGGRLSIGLRYDSRACR